MIKVELKSNNNPFYGLKNCLALMNKATENIDTKLLDSCWQEVKENKEHREMFFSLLFSIGDITARQHNIFKGIKKDSGGNANREGFYTIFKWLKDNHKEQFIKFLNTGLFNEYTCFDLLFRSRVQTRGANIIKVYDAFADTWYTNQLLKYTYSVINGTNPFNKLLVAKFLTVPRLSKRKDHNKMLPETYKVMCNKRGFLIKLSELMGWDSHNFKGYREWRKQYNGDLESVLFSTGKINEFNKTQFIEWLDKLPSQARFRVKNRVLYSKIKDTENLKYPNLAIWYNDWEEYKTKKQEEQRILEEKVRQGQASTEDKVKLEKVKKEAKVNTGATNFKELYNNILCNNVDPLKLESFIQNKVNLPYNSLVIIDDSGSMGGAPFSFATFLASVCLVKNPDDDARNLLGFFNSRSHWHSFIDKTSSRPNSLLRNTIAQTNAKPLVDGTLSFYDNYDRIKKFCNAVFQGGGTHLDCIPKDLEYIIKENPSMLDELKKYPIWTICSDGDLNSHYNARESMIAFQHECKRILGYVPFIVIIEIYKGFSPKVSHFEGLENIMYIPGNPAQIEQFLTNFKDMDTFDVYTPLQSLYRSDRYEIVRTHTI